MYFCHRWETRSWSLMNKSLFFVFFFRLLTVPLPFTLTVVSWILLLGECGVAFIILAGACVCATPPSGWIYCTFCIQKHFCWIDNVDSRHVNELLLLRITDTDTCTTVIYGILMKWAENRRTAQNNICAACAGTNHLMFAFCAWVCVCVFWVFFPRRLASLLWNVSTICREREREFAHRTYTR